MSGMDGNPHYADYQMDLGSAELFDCAVSQLHATLALAYEQRTANMLAYFAATRDGDKRMALIDQIDARLALSEASA